MQTANIKSFLDNFDSGKQQKMLEVYIASFEQQDKICREAVANDRPQDAMQAVHDLKSLSHMIGAEQTGLHAAEIEMLLRDDNRNAAAQQLPELISELNKVKSALKSYCI